MGVFILMLIIVGVGVTVAATKSGGTNSDATWRAAAQRLGLRFERTDLMSSPTISGTRRGLSVRIDTYAKSGDNSRTCTRYRVSFKKSLGLGLSLTRQGPLSRVAKKLGTQDILTGDEDFDAAVVIKGRDPHSVREYLTAARRLRTVRFLTLYPGSTIDDVKIESESRDVERSPDHIVQMIQHMTGLAENLTADDAGPDYLEAMAPAEVAAVDGHSLVLPERSEPWPITLEELLPVVIEPVDGEEQAHSFPEEHEASDLPTPPEPDHADLDVPRLEESRPAETAHSADDGPDTGTTLKALFAQGLTTSQTTEQFENAYKDKTVVWSGKLTNVRSYRFDLVFGDVPGTRVELVIVEANDPLAAGRPIKVVVQFPTEAEDKLRALVDQQVGFRGVLLSCDAFMKTLFLSDGQINEVHA